MAFPTTGILDDFNRSNEGPPITGWTDVNAGLKIVSNAVQMNDAYNLSYWNAETFGPDSEAYITITTKTSTDGGGVHVSVRYDVDLLNGYYVKYEENTGGTDAIKLYRDTEDSGTLLDSWSQEISNGDSIGISAIGNILTAYYKAGAGAWTALGTYDISGDTPKYTGAGYLVVQINDCSASPVLDNFGGGTYVPPAADVGGIMTPRSGYWGDL